MLSVKEIQRIVDRVKSGNLPTNEMRDLVHHQSPLVRANALESLVESAQHTGILLDDLIKAALDTTNSVRLMGTISVAHVAVSCLLRVGTPEALQAAHRLWISWPEPDRKDLTWYLESEGLQIG